MQKIWLLPHYVDFGAIDVSQTLIASAIGTALFVLLGVSYRLVSFYNQKSIFVGTVDMAVEGIMTYLKDVWGSHVWWGAVVFTTGIFFYVLWMNIVWLLWDMIVLAVPQWHDYFRPAGSDVMFNAVLATVWVVWAIVYWFIVKGFHHIEHYIPYKGIGIVPKVTSVWTALGRIGDVAIWVLIGFIELMGELGRITSLSLRLFGNIFVGIILLWLVTQAANALFFDTPFLIPLTMFAYELVVACLQAFLFSLLVTVYFRIASDPH